MVQKDAGHEGTNTPEPLEKGFATLATLRYAHIYIALRSLI